MKAATSLTKEDQLLVALRNDLYKGDWAKMLKDLKDRVETRPYIFRLVNQIHDDIERIEMLQKRGI